MSSFVEKQMKKLTEIIVVGFIRDAQILLPNETNSYYNIPTSIACMIRSFINNYYKNSGIYKWKISDINMIDKIVNAKFGDCFESNTFMLARLKWKLEIFPNGDEQENKGYFVIRLRLLSVPSIIDNIEFSRIFRIFECNAGAAWVSQITCGDNSKWSRKCPLTQIIDINPTAITIECEINVHQLILKMNNNYPKTTMITQIQQGILGILSDTFNPKKADKILALFNNIINDQFDDIESIMDDIKKGEKSWIISSILSNIDYAIFDDKEEHIRNIISSDIGKIFSNHTTPMKYHLVYALSKEDVIDFKNSKPDKTMCGDILHNMWMIQCTPNGDGELFWGKVSVFLVLYMLPIGIAKLKTIFKIGCPELDREYTLKHEFSMKSFGWGASDFATMDEMKGFETITLIIDVEVTHITYQTDEEMVQINDPIQITKLLTQK